MDRQFNESATAVNLTPVTLEPQWGTGAPKGARAVFSRIIKEGANVPLFLGQTVISALRDLGYNNSTSASGESVGCTAEGREV